MNACILDASVVAAAFLREEHAEAARRLLASESEFRAPDLIYAELANVIWKRYLRGELDEAEAHDLLQEVMLQVPIHATPSRSLVGQALELALQTKRTVYDCLYLALAVREGGQVVTGDRRLANALAGGPLERYVRWVGAM